MSMICDNFFEEMKELYVNNKQNVVGINFNNIPTKFLRRRLLKKFCLYIIENQYTYLIYTVEDLYRIISVNCGIDV